MRLKLKKYGSKAKMTKLIYEFRYYAMLPYDEKRFIYEVEELKKEMEQVGKKILEQANHMKVIEKFSKQEEINYQLLKEIFQVRSINLEEIYIKLTKEKEKYFIQLFDENAFEEKKELTTTEILNKKDLYIRFNKKVKVFY